MLWANVNGIRVLASPGARGTCPSCGGEVIAKCGQIVKHHWAHKNSDCPFATEPETDWHREWKALFPAEMQEVTVGNHRADVKAPWGVIEIQHSPISLDELQKREAHYGERMLWVVDLNNADIDMLREHRTRKVEYLTWKRMRKAYRQSARTIIFDYRHHPNIREGSTGLFLWPERRWCTGDLKGVEITMDEFLNRCLNPQGASVASLKEAELAAIREADQIAEDLASAPSEDFKPIRYWVTPYEVDGHLIFAEQYTWRGSRLKQRQFIMLGDKRLRVPVGPGVDRKAHNVLVKWPEHNLLVDYLGPENWAKSCTKLHRMWRRPSR